MNSLVNDLPGDLDDRKGFHKATTVYDTCRDVDLQLLPERCHVGVWARTVPTTGPTRPVVWTHSPATIAATNVWVPVTIRVHHCTGGGNDIWSCVHLKDEAGFRGRSVLTGLVPKG